MYILIESMISLDASFGMIQVTGSIERGLIFKDDVWRCGERLNNLIPVMQMKSVFF